jgi:hypothetical protein
MQRIPRAVAQPAQSVEVGPILRLHLPVAKTTLGIAMIDTIDLTHRLPTFCRTYRLSAYPRKENL